jgi:two-component system, chemotaxis family, chemotaxis protein CheY
MRILVVDDDQDLNRLICIFLERNGFQVHAAADGLQAMDSLEQHDDIGLAIVDLNMPHVDGIQLVKQIKAHPKHREVPVIMVSASADEAKVDQSMRSGAGLFLPKPVDFDRLLTLVRFAG